MDEEMLYPIGIQTFEKIRRENKYYVDKTSHVYRLAHLGNYYFLSRPRRFGKSLLISTLDAYFSGKRELFEGLAIAELEKEWAVYPVLRLDLNAADYKQESSLHEILNKALNGWEKDYGASSDEVSPALRFQGVVQRAFEQTGRQVVILVDEYDKPLLSTMLNEPLQAHYRAQLKAFYSVLKSQDRYIRFALLTGVTKFSKVSIFSDLNNLMDISMLPEFADICGITEEEIHNYFEPQLHHLAAAQGMTYEEALNKLRQMYDGYHFGPNVVGVYNPFSLLCALRTRSYGSYWFETGTPTFLVDILKEIDFDLERLTHEDVNAKTLGDISNFRTYPIPMLYQSGYLTIHDYDAEFRTYTLGFPNHEVEEDFTLCLLPRYLPILESQGATGLNNFVRDVRRGDAESFMQRLQSFYEGIDYRMAGDREKYFHNSLFLLFHLMGFYTQVERHTSRGSIDIVVQTKDYIYVIECKLDKSAHEALQQIEDKRYAAPFASDPRKLFKIGVNFSSKTRSVDEYEIAP